MDKRKREYNTFLREKNGRKTKQCYCNKICIWKRDSFSSEFKTTREIA